MLLRGPNRLLGDGKGESGGPLAGISDCRREEPTREGQRVVRLAARQREQTLASCRTGVGRTKEIYICLSRLQTIRDVQSERTGASTGGSRYNGRKCLSIMPTKLGHGILSSAHTRHVRRRHQPCRIATDTDQDGPWSALRWTDACSYTILTHYRQWGSCKAVGEHRVSPCRDNLRIVYAST